MLNLPPCIRTQTDWSNLIKASAPSPRFGRPRRQKVPTHSRPTTTPRPRNERDKTQSTVHGDQSISQRCGVNPASPNPRFLPFNRRAIKWAPSARLGGSGPGAQAAFFTTAGASPAAHHRTDRRRIDPGVLLYCTLGIHPRIDPI